MNIKISLSKLTTCLLILVLAHPSLAADKQEQQKLDKIKRDISALKAELEASKSDRDRLLQTLENSEKAIGDLSKKAEQLKAELEGREVNLEQMRDERSSLQDRKQGQQQQVSQHINAAYRLGQQSSVRLLLNQQDPTTVARNLKYFDYLTRARADKIDEFSTVIGRINQIEPEIAFQTQKLENNHRQLANKRDALQHAQKKRQSTLSRLNTNIANQDQHLQAMYKDRQRLEQLLNQVADWLDDIKVPQSNNSFATLKGKLPWPTRGRVLKNFGASRITNKLAWQGMLIGSNQGTPVSSIHHGRIIFSDYLRGHGLLIIVDHGAGYMSLYAHNQALYKELGEWVDVGEIIASVGNSGGQQQFALYFELRYQGQPTNPKRWFRPA